MNKRGSCDGSGGGVLVIGVVVGLVVVVVVVVVLVAVVVGRF